MTRKRLRLAGRAVEDRRPGEGQYAFESAGHRIDDRVAVAAVTPKRLREMLAAGEPGDGAVEVDAGQELLHDLAQSGVSGPFMVRAPTEHGLAYRMGVEKLVALVQIADEQPALAGDAAAAAALGAPGRPSGKVW